MASKGFDLNCDAFEADEKCGLSSCSGGIADGGSRVLGGISAEIGGESGIADGGSKDRGFYASGINLVVDLDSCYKVGESKVVKADNGESSNAVGVDGCPGALIPEGGAKEGEFHVSDLVWGKVRSYPWWPGQIIEPSAASAKARRKDSYLVAYFGDESLVWSEASKLRPFETHFSEMSKQSSDAAFCQAVNAALEEYSRRIQVGASTHVYGGETATAFQPGELVAYLQSLAKSPQAGCDALKLATAKAHLASFYRSKGYNELPCVENFVLGEDSDLRPSLKEDDLDQMIDVELDSGDDYIAAYGKRKSPSSGLDQPEPLGESKKPRLDLKSASSSSVQKDDQDPPSDNSLVKKPDEPFGEASSSTNYEVVKSDSQEEPAHSVPVRRGRGRPRKAVVEKAEPLREAKKLDFIPGSSPSFPNGQKESEAKSDSPKEPPCSVPVYKGRGRPRKVVENADPVGEAKISEGAESVSVYAGETVQPVRRGRGRPRKTVALSESGTSSLTGEKYQECPPASELLSKLCAAAASPMEGGYEILTPVAGFLGNFRNSVCLESDKNMDRAFEKYKKAQATKEAADKEAYEAYEEYKKARAAKEAAEGYCPTGLIFKFSSLDSLHSVARLNEIYGEFGPLEESETKVLHKSKRLVFLFKRRCDAERAFSSSGKYAIFGPALDSYRLDYEPFTSKSSSAKRRRRK